MPVNVKTVQGRRRLTFQSFDQILADAEALAASPHTKTLGNWPLNQLLTHLANAMNMSIDGIPHKAPWFIRLLGPMIKGHVLRRGMSPGFRLPEAGEKASFRAAPTDQDALEQFRRAIHRVKTEPMTAAHPVFGRITTDEWRLLHYRHAELHLSFAVP